MQPTDYLTDSIRLFHRYKELAEKALAQIPEEAWFALPDPEANSIALIMKHVAGNLRSRWTDFLTTDGEKPDRNRDTEFELDGADSAGRLREFWEDGWKIMFDALEPLTMADMDRTVYIREEPHTVLQAINRQLTHYAYHVGQIVYLAKHYTGADWSSLSIPKRKLA